MSSEDILLNIHKCTVAVFFLSQFTPVFGGVSAHSRRESVPSLAGLPGSTRGRLFC